MKLSKLLIVFFVLVTLTNSFALPFSNKNLYTLVIDSENEEKIEYAVRQLKDAFRIKGITLERVTSINQANTKHLIVVKKSIVSQLPESYTISKLKTKNKQTITINAFDDQGIMYGLLDVAERISWSENEKGIFAKVQNLKEEPAIAERAVSTYTMNRRYWESRLYNEDYWKRYFDLLAKSRFNMFTIIFGYENGGFLAPCYPYFFDVEAYPNVQLKGLSKENQKKNLFAMNRIIQLAHERGIKITLGIWDHIFRGGIQSGDMGNGANVDLEKNVIVTGLNSENLIPYTAQALNKLIKELPGLDAIQFRMHGESGLKHGEQRPFWNDLFQSIKKNHPNMRLVLRAKDLPDEIIQDAVKSGVDFSIGTKFWMEQTGLPYSPTQVYKQDQKNRRHGYADMLRYPEQYKMYWRLWTGGTNRILTWGDPEYASRLVKSLDIYDKGSYAFEVNEMLATKMEAQPHDEMPFELLNPAYQYYDYEFERYWDFYMSYGRKGYNPDASSEIWTKEYNQHFGQKVGPILKNAIHTAAKILPRIVASCYNYSFFPTTRGWAEKQRIGDLDVYAKAQGSDVQQFANFEEEAQLMLNGGETAKILPSTNSRWLKNVSDKVVQQITKAENEIGNNGNKEFNATIVDLKILSNLALYHSRRIPAAVYYNIYKRTMNPVALDSALVHERNAINAWKKIVESAGNMYASNLKFGPAHTGFEGVKFEQSGHWRDELLMLENDLKGLEVELEKIKNVNLISKIPTFDIPEKESNSSYFSVEHKPVISASANTSILIKVKVKAPAGLKWIHLKYRAVNQYLNFESLPMEPTLEKDTYQAIIPADKIDSTFDLMYLFEMMDNNNKGFIYPDLNKETPYTVVHLER